MKNNTDMETTTFYRALKTDGLGYTYAPSKDFFNNTMHLLTPAEPIYVGDGYYGGTSYEYVDKESLESIEIDDSILLNLLDGEERTFEAWQILKPFIIDKFNEKEV